MPVLSPSRAARACIGLRKFRGPGGRPPGTTAQAEPGRIGYRGHVEGAVCGGTGRVLLNLLGSGGFSQGRVRDAELLQIGRELRGVVVELAHLLAIFGHSLGVEFNSGLIGIGD